MSLFLARNTMEDLTHTIQPITQEQQIKISEETHHYIKQAVSLFEIKTKPVEITFDLKGRASGMYRVYRNKREIRYNPHIFSKYFEDNFNSTIPHEVAHYITDIIYGLSNIRPHGKEWKAVMHAFNADASVTSNYDLSGIPLKKQTLFTYHCNCQDHQISSIRHNRVKRNRGKYYCVKCKHILRWKNPANKAA